MSIVVDKDLSTRVQSYYPSGLIAHQVLPTIGVQEFTGVYHWHGTDPKGTGEDRIYRVNEYAQEFAIHDDESSEVDALARLKLTLDRIYIDQEIRVANLLTDTQTYAAGHLMDYRSVDAIDRTWDRIVATLGWAMRSIRDRAYGKEANVLIVPPHVETALVGETKLRKPLDLRMLRPTLIHTGDDLGVSNVWGDNIVVAYVDPYPATVNTFTLGASLVPRAPIVKRYRDEEAKKTFYRVSTVSDERLFAPNCAFLIRNVLAS